MKTNFTFASTNRNNNMKNTKLLNLGLFIIVWAMFDCIYLLCASYLSGINPMDILSLHWYELALANFWPATIAAMIVWMINNDGR